MENKKIQKKYLFSYVVTADETNHCLILKVCSPSMSILIALNQSLGILHILTSLLCSSHCCFSSLAFRKHCRLWVKISHCLSVPTELLTLLRQTWQPLLPVNMGKHQRWVPESPSRIGYHNHQPESPSRWNALQVKWMAHGKEVTFSERK